MTICNVLDSLVPFVQFKFLKKNFFQAYDVENIKLVASEKRSFNNVPEMVLFPKIYT